MVLRALTNSPGNEPDDQRDPRIDAIAASLADAGIAYDDFAATARARRMGSNPTRSAKVVAVIDEALAVLAIVAADMVANDRVAAAYGKASSPYFAQWPHGERIVIATDLTFRGAWRQIPADFHRDVFSWGLVADDVASHGEVQEILLLADRLAGTDDPGLLADPAAVVNAAHDILSVQLTSAA